MYILEATTFFSPSTYPINLSFSVVACIHSIHVFDDAFCSFSNLSQLKKYFYSVSMAIIVRKTNSFITIKQLINTKTQISLKKSGSTNKGHSVQIFHFITKTQTLVPWSKCCKTTFLGFHYHFFIYLTDFDLFNLSYFA